MSALPQQLSWGGAVQSLPEGILVDLGAASAFFPRRSSSATGMSLDLSLQATDRAFAIERILRTAGAGDRRPMGMAQQHGALTLRAAQTEGLPECDALITDSRDLALVALAADCVPIAISSDDHVGVVHAGWRGLSAGVIESALDAVRAAGSSGRIKAAIGPSARGCCYEVSAEVLSAVGAHGVANGRMLDTGATAEMVLRANGVKDVDLLEDCTICGSPDRYFSYRVEGSAAGRQGVVAWLNR